MFDCVCHRLVLSCHVFVFRKFNERLNVAITHRQLTRDKILSQISYLTYALWLAVEHKPQTTRLRQLSIVQLLLCPSVL